MLNLKKKLKNVEKIFHFLRDILGILHSFRYSSSSEPVNYHFSASNGDTNPESIWHAWVLSPKGEEKQNFYVHAFLKCFEF